VIDYAKEDLRKGTKCYDLVLGVNGNHPLRVYRRLLCEGGTYVMVGGGLPQIFKSLAFGWLFSFGSKKMTSVAAKPNSRDLVFIANLVAQGTIKPVIDRTFNLDEAPAAMEYMSKGHSKGKVVVSVLRDNN
jgi:NADPH:quinone reductase-like Zn-dependent oxidoreductase